MYVIGRIDMVLGGQENLLEEVLWKVGPWG